MSTYTLSGTGTHALTTNTTGLRVTITTPSSIGGLGNANPVNRYHQGLFRFSDGTAYWDAVPITGGPEFIPVPANATSLGYSMISGCVVSVEEVIGGQVFFSAGATALSALSDVTIASVSNGQLLAWNASDGKWENITPSEAPVVGLTCRIHRSSTQSISQNVSTIISFDVTDYDPLGAHSVSVNPSRITVPSTGWYEVVGALSLPPGAGPADLRIFVNGAGVYEDTRQTVAAYGNGMRIVVVDHFTAADYVELAILQNIATENASTASMALTRVA